MCKWLLLLVVKVFKPQLQAEKSSFLRQRYVIYQKKGALYEHLRLNNFLNDDTSVSLNFKSHCWKKEQPFMAGLDRQWI